MPGCSASRKRAAPARRHGGQWREHGTTTHHSTTCPSKPAPTACRRGPAQRGMVGIGLIIVGGSLSAHPWVSECAPRRQCVVPNVVQLGSIRRHLGGPSAGREKPNRRNCEQGQHRKAGVRSSSGMATRVSVTVMVWRDSVFSPCGDQHFCPALPRAGGNDRG